MPQREWSSTASVNGFNGMRKDDEWQGSGNAYDFGARIYDPRLGRWMARDPMMAQFPYQSPYISFDDNPIAKNDPTGMAAEWVPDTDEQGNTTYTAEKGDNLETFKKQYGLSDDKAKDIFARSNLNAAGDVQQGKEIKGSTVKDVTGSDILKLNLGKATDKQIGDQLIFAMKKTNMDSKQGKDNYDFSLEEYYSNVLETKSSGLSFNYSLNIEGKTVTAYIEIATSYDQNRIESFPTDFKQIEKSKIFYMNMIFYRSTDKDVRTKIPAVLIQVPDDNYKSTDAIEKNIGLD